MRLEPAAGDVVADRYVIGRVLGHGGMGVVHLAYDRTLERDVAVKFIATTAPHDVKRFQLEALALASIESPNVIGFHAFGRSNKTYYYTMDHVDGSTLEEVIAREAPPLPVGFVHAVLADIARGLDDAHGAGFVHRDVKPANILVDARRGRALLFDFGLAFPWRLSDGRSATPAGSPSYMAPEAVQARSLPGGELGPWTDEYSLACTGFEMLAGAPPFQASSVAELLRKHLVAAPPKLSLRRPELAALDPVFARSLAKDPAERFGSATAMAAAVRQALRPIGLRGLVRPLFRKPVARAHRA